MAGTNGPVLARVGEEAVGIPLEDFVAGSRGVWPELLDGLLYMRVTAT